MCIYRIPHFLIPLVKDWMMQVAPTVEAKEDAEVKTEDGPKEQEAEAPVNNKRKRQADEDCNLLKRFLFVAPVSMAPEKTVIGWLIY